MIEKMSKKTASTALEQLQYKRELLQKDAEIYGLALEKHFEYLQKNMGFFIFSLTVSAIKSNLYPVAKNFLTTRHESKANQSTDISGTTPRINRLTEMLFKVLPVVFKNLQPLLVAYLLKKLKTKN